MVTCLMPIAKCLMVQDATSLRAGCPSLFCSSWSLLAIPGLWKHHSVSASIFTWHLSFCLCPNHPPVPTFIQGPILYCDLILTNCVTIMLFPDKLISWYQELKLQYNTLRRDMSMQSATEATWEPFLTHSCSMTPVAALDMSVSLSTHLPCV